VRWLVGPHDTLPDLGQARHDLVEIWNVIYIHSGPGPKHPAGMRKDLTNLMDNVCFAIPAGGLEGCDNSYYPNF